MQRISKLLLENFKFFYNKVELDFERKNVLIYGENGSGKSSIYWALYTFLQSVFKTDVAQIRKYFDSKSEQNLINRFADDKCDCGITVEFVDDDKSTTIREISNGAINTQRDLIVKEAAQASDFLTYKLLARLYDFKNSQDINLFPLFADELLMFINFRENLVRHDGTTGTANAYDWWKYISTGLNPKPNINEEPYKIFHNAVNKFNYELDYYLKKITESVNEYLRKFKQNIRLTFKYRKAIYDAFEKGSKKKRNNKTFPPKIILNVSFNHEKLADHKKDILRPQTFLNEARLTAIALGTCKK